MLIARQIKRILIAILGSLVVLLGIAMIVLPGPAVIVIPAGLAILATEFERPRHWLRHVRERIATTLERSRKSAASRCRNKRKPA